MAWRWELSGEYMVILPHDFNEHDWSEIEDIMIMANNIMERQDR